jgi:gamma-carbonic anhydrase
VLQSFLDQHPQIDPRAYVHPAAVVIGRVTLGADSSVWPCATLRGDDGPIAIGASTSIQDGTVIHMTEGRSVTTIGDRVTVGHNATLHGCTIFDECIIGMGAIVLDNAIIETGSIIGAGSLVPPGKRIPAGSVAFGNPIKVVRSCTDADREFIAFSWQAYVHRTAQYLAESL